MPPFGNFFEGAAAFLAGTAAIGQDFVNNNIAPVAIDTVARLGELRHEHVAPAFVNAGEGLNKGLEFANNHIAPVIVGTMSNIQENFGPAVGNMMSEVSKGLHDFGEVHLGPALQGTSDALNQFGEKQLGPAVSVSLATLNDLGEKQILPGLYLTGATLKEIQEKQLNPVLTTLSDFSREKIAPAMDEAAKWVQDHPGQTVMIVGAGVIVVCPGLVTTPALWVLGFGSEGVGVGSLAAVAHSAIGDVAAGSLFATLQSAGAGGAGLVIVDAAVSTGALGIGALKIIDATRGHESFKEKL